MTPTVGFSGRLAATFLHSKLTPLFILASLALGAFAVLALPREEEPQIIVPMVDVFVEVPGASPAEVEQRVTRPLEKLLWEIPGVEYLYSTSSPGLSMVIVRFEVGEDEERALVRLNQKLAANADRIPPGLEVPVDNSFSGAVFSSQQPVVVRDGRRGTRDLRLQPGEDDRVRADAECQNGDNDCGSGLVAGEVAEGEAQVAAEGVDPAHAARVARVFLEHGHIAELASRRQSRLVGRQTARHQTFGGAVDVLAHLVLHVALERAASQQGAQAKPDPAHRIHVVFRIAPSAPANRSHPSRCSASCVRPAAVSE